MPRPSSRLLATFLPIAAGLGLLAPTCRADLIIEVLPVTAAVGSSGSFDVLLYNNGVGGATYNVSGDDVSLSISGPAGVTITGATIATTTPYIYQESGTTQGGGPFVTGSTSTSFQASDSEFAGPNYYDPVAPGQTFGLAHVTYTVSASAVAGSMGMFSLAGSDLSDVNGNPIHATLSDGTITLTAAVSTPPSLITCSLGLVTGLIAWVRRSYG